MDKKDHFRNLIYTDWILNETKFNPEYLHSRETIFTIGNGFGVVIAILITTFSALGLW